MAFLTPDRTYTEHGLEIKEKLITANSGVKYYSNRKLATPDHKPAWITIHNTADIDEAPGTNDAEQYARATFNNNMGDVVVHYYIDEADCWHILADDTVGYHAANSEGNNTSVAVEIIMDGSGKGYDLEAEDRGALLAAILLNKYELEISNLTTHYRWYSGKYCPVYILPHWDEFKAKVENYLRKIRNGSAVKPEVVPTTPQPNKNYLTYPMKNMYVSQNYTDGYSHAPHSNGTPPDYPIDDCGAGSDREWFYCPCDEMKIAHIYGVGTTGTNTIWLESTSKVVMPSGEDYVTILVMHPNDDTLGGLREGQTFKRGEKMFIEGNDGWATGYHFHMAVGTGKFAGSGWVSNSNGKWVNKTTGKQLKPEEAFWIDDDFTKVLTTGGITFKHLAAAANEAPEKAEANGKIFRVQIGAYKDRENADALAEKAKAAGFSANVMPYIKGDVDGDGEVTAADARATLRLATGLEE